MIASLTDWQILELYIRPAERRAEEESRRIKGLPPLPTEDAKPQGFNPQPGSPQHRAMWEHAYREFTGRSAKAAREEYDRVLKNGRIKR